MRAATLEEDYPNSNMMVQEQLEDGSWSEPRTFRKGDVQPMIFSEGDGPPFYSPSLDPNNYVNMPKGIRQVLWERGLLKPDMTLDGKWVDGPGNKPVRVYIFIGCLSVQTFSTKRLLCSCK